MPNQEQQTQPLPPVRLRVALHADLRRFLPQGVNGAFPVELRTGATVSDLLEALGIPDRETITVGLNGELAKRDSELHDSDDITMFSPMEGG
ncbi:MAG: MoaD/ThiS family protein [Dehalococcoidia bacterium]